MNNTLKALSSRLPARFQQELKKLHFARQIRKGTFETDEAEFGMLANWVQPGDWVLDVGANIGHYSRRMSELVGATGRVIAFEPVPETFELLACNVSLFPLKNVTVVNMAASRTTQMLGMSVPKFDSGLDNYYMAHLTENGGMFQVLCAPVDNFGFEKISLVKIDAEGHELDVVKGMAELIKRDHPVLIVELSGDETKELLESFGYESTRQPGSSNRIFEYPS